MTETERFLSSRPDVTANANNSNTNSNNVAAQPRSFSDSVEWATSSAKNSEDKNKSSLSSNKYMFWIILSSILAIMLIIWLLIKYFGKESTQGHSDHHLNVKSGSIINEMNNLSASVTPMLGSMDPRNGRSERGGRSERSGRSGRSERSGRNSRRKLEHISSGDRSRRSESSFVNPLPPMTPDISRLQSKSSSRHRNGSRFHDIYTDPTSIRSSRKSYSRR